VFVPQPCPARDDHRMRMMLVLDCQDPDRLADFWSAAAGWKKADRFGQYVALVADDKPVFLLQQVPEPKQGKNRMHLDLHPDDLDTEIARLVALGATRLSDEPVTGFDHQWVVMADPEGNEFCVCTACC
jgi:predicted enzyme related to lactoylglutathione lyase